jgi:hypothetical protein
MKPKYEMKLVELIRYIYSDCLDYKLIIYKNDNQAYSGTVECSGEFGYDYLKVTEWFRDDTIKKVIIYTLE